MSFIEDFDFKSVDKQQKGYLIYRNMNEALTQTQAILGKDTDGIKILSCMLKVSADTYEIYQKKGVSDKIYFDTMKCFTRFIDETYKMTGELCFDRYWWTTRQAGCHSWLLDGQLKGMLSDNSNIICFQNRFEIFDEGEVGKDFVEWLYNTKSTDYATLPENTSLQINMKKHLLADGEIRNSYGRLKEIY